MGLIQICCGSNCATLGLNISGCPGGAGQNGSTTTPITVTVTATDPNGNTTTVTGKNFSCLTPGQTYQIKVDAGPRYTVSSGTSVTIKAGSNTAAIKLQPAPGYACFKCCAMPVSRNLLIKGRDGSSEIATNSGSGNCWGAYPTSAALVDSTCPPRTSIGYDEQIYSPTQKSGYYEWDANCGAFKCPTDNSNTQLYQASFLDGSTIVVTESGGAMSATMATATSVTDDRAARRQAAIDSGRIADSHYASNMTLDQAIESCPCSDICFCSQTPDRPCDHPARPDRVDRATCIRCQSGEFDQS